MWQALKGSRLVGYLGLFSSFGTLACCAIPSTLVLLGFGAGLASFLSKYPQLIWPSENKEWVFGISFGMLGLSWASQKYAATKVCPVDKKEDCEATKGWSGPLLLVTFLINVVGVFYAFILPRLL